MKLRVKDPNGKPNHYIDIKVSYRKAGTSWATHERYKGGYYCTVVPVECNGNITTFGAFTGFNYHLVDASRRSKKKEQQAIELAKSKKDWFVEQIQEMRSREQ